MIAQCIQKTRIFYKLSGKSRLKTRTLHQNRKQSGTQWLAKRMWIGPKSKKIRERKNVERCKAVLEDGRYCQRHLSSFCPQHPWQLLLYRVLQVWVNIEKIKTGRLQKKICKLSQNIQLNANLLIAQFAMMVTAWYSLLCPVVSISVIFCFSFFF